ncbi:MAG TPA: bifunctional pyr operon transcriptional regulator/uracil phosphoribosyltransferase PyrR [Solirubrobacteraceae bacterium]|nr:bifunctional pyr operon transcriptional regulator/uracil phosphoribosyltransferase PyrR [Solirubrobacteraceae bacterium]
MSTDKKVVLREREMSSALVRIAHEIAERNTEGPAPALVGIHRRGVFLARRLRETLNALLEEAVPYGELDIGLYRDDLAVRGLAPVVYASSIEFDPTGRTVVIVDDVLYTGRTVRAAIDALFDFGRPGRVQLAVLVDRGHRELPIRPDYVGKNIPTARSEHVAVALAELDRADEVLIRRRSPLSHA